VLLFSILLFLALHKQDYRILLLPVLASSQIWYVFSYFNSDAFSLFISLLAVYQLVVGESIFNRILNEGFHGKNVLCFFGIAFLFSLMLMMKMNFYFFIVFCFLYLIWKIIFKEISLTKVFLFRLLAIALVGGLMVGIVRVGDIYINGFNKGAKTELIREKFASLIYKPSTPFDKKYPYMQMKDRGSTLKSLFTLNHWGESSFQSSFGVYDYVTIKASFFYYDFVKLMGGGLLALIVMTTIFKGGLKGNSLMILALLCSFSLVGTALYRSWTVDFQPQGRYLLPIVSIFSILIFHNRKYFITSAFNLLLVSMFLLSTYSFIFTGLYGIEKYVF
jgi:hypothetical protein